jgi:hypothetical protein
LPAPSQLQPADSATTAVAEHALTQLVSALIKQLAVLTLDDACTTSGLDAAADQLLVQQSDSQESRLGHVLLSEERWSDLLQDTDLARVGQRVAGEDCCCLCLRISFRWPVSVPVICLHLLACVCAFTFVCICWPVSAPKWGLLVPARFPVSFFVNILTALLLGNVSSLHHLFRRTISLREAHGAATAPKLHA